MGNQLFISMVYNASLLMVMVAIYSGIRFSIPFGSALPSGKRDILTGVLIGLIGVAVMANPWMMRPGIFFDARTILLGIAGLFFGFVPAVLAVAITGTFRMIVDGAGAWSGLGSIISSAVIGLLWRRSRPGSEQKGGILELYLFGVSVQLLQLACYFILPWQLALEVLRKVALPVMAVYPVGTVLLAMLLIHQRKSRDMEETLYESELKYKTLVENSNDAVFFNGLQPDGAPAKFLEVSKRACASLGYSRDELLGLTPLDITAGESPDVRRGEVMAELARSGHAVFEVVHTAKDGHKIPVEISSSTFEYAGRPHVLSIARDITERKHAETERAKLESQLLQSQKMEAVGRLAGGVAHDFNNILTAIKYYGGLIRDGFDAPDPRRADAQEILDASDRAASLTRQLLIFSRHQVIMPKLVDLNRIVADMGKMLHRLIGEDVKLEIRLAVEPCFVMADTGRLEQVVMNLAVNARDAMPLGGTLTLETGIISPDDVFFAAHPALGRGQLARLTARDTGRGMTADVRSHAFEPFFTTKPAGRGTGLGLATIMGIIRESGGEIELASEPDKGATFVIYLPLAAPAAARPEEGKNIPVRVRGSETVMLVEDERSMRRLVERLLRSDGYEVIAAADGAEALLALEQRGKAVDALITDVVMPGMNGRELAREVERRKLAGRTLYMSGYTDETITKHGVLEPGLAFIYKPFTAEAFSAKLREVLDGPAEQAKP